MQLVLLCAPLPQATCQMALAWKPPTNQNPFGGVLPTQCCPPYTQCYVDASLLHYSPKQVQSIGRKPSNSSSKVNSDNTQELPPLLSHYYTHHSLGDWEVGMGGDRAADVSKPPGQAVWKMFHM